MNWNLKVKLNGHKIEPSEHIKYLGIYIDKHMNGEAHCSKVLPKLQRAYGILAILRHYLPTKELLNIYHSIFSSHLTYACQAWGQQRNKYFNKLVTQQNNAMRIITFSYFRSSADPLYRKNNILKITDHIYMSNCLLVHQWMNKKLPSLFNVFFSLKQSMYD